MKITIQYFDGCPHWNFAQKRLKKVLRDVRRDAVEVNLEVIDSPEAAERARFRGSPGFLFDGRDSFAKDDQPFGLTGLLVGQVATAFPPVQPSQS